MTVHLYIYQIKAQNSIVRVPCPREESGDQAEPASRSMQTTEHHSQRKSF